MEIAGRAAMENKPIRGIWGSARGSGANSRKAMVKDSPSRADRTVITDKVIAEWNSRMRFAHIHASPDWE